MQSPIFTFFLTALIGITALVSNSAASQPSSFDASWYDASAPHVKIAVAEDGVYKVRGQDLANAGVALSAVSASTMRLYENGREIPIHVESKDAGSFSTSDWFAFVGQRNRGKNEVWAYNYDPALQSSPHRSLYTDTTYYWLTWGGEPGRRYQEVNDDPPDGATDVSALRDTLHLETDSRYYYGDTRDVGHPLYTRGEGYYWASVSGGSSWSRSISLPAPVANGDFHVRVKLNGASRYTHRAMLELDTGDGFQTVTDTLEWYGYAFRTLGATIDQSELPTDGQVRLRIRSLGGEGSFLVDYVEADYVRMLRAEDGAQSFTVPEAGSYEVATSGYTASTLHVFNERDRRYRAVSLQNGKASFGASPSAPARYWAVQPDAMRAPVAIHQDEPSNLAASSNQADYVILTAPALTASAQELAAYRRSEAGGSHSVKVVDVRDVFDQFDYGRRTPIAIRRFVRATQQWQQPARFLTIWADAPYPIRTSGRYEGTPSWAVLSYGYAPSDGWFAMQTEGLEDWSEIIAVGRVPIRTNAEGNLFLQKMRTHEEADPAPWRKRMLALAGGTSVSQQGRLQRANDDWTRVAAQPPTGMDTLKFYKKSDASLDNSFQDSLSVALRRGVSWLNYFGHSAANTWEIVTDSPSDFDNAGRLPFVVSLGCRTGSFAGGRHETRGSRSFGELLLLGSDSKTTTTSSNGAIAHFGASSSGTIRASRLLNDKLIDAVFRDSMRVMGLATQTAKNRYASSGINLKHTLQYGLLGDPAARLAIPAQPDLKIAEEDVEINPLSPVPADSQLTVRVHPRNLGLTPRDSFTVSLAHRYKASGAYQTVERYKRRVAPFRLSKTLSFTLPIDDSLVGDHRVTVQADADQEYPEVSEMNNEASKDKTVFSTNVSLISPQDFGLVTTQNPSLRVSLASADQIDTPVRFELSETASFETLLATDTVKATRIDAAWQPPMPLQEGGTYFWRARVEATGGADTWSSSAFTVRPDLSDTGWLQQGALFQQNTSDEYLRRQDGSWTFSTYNFEVFSSAERGSGSYKGQFSVNGTERREYLTLGIGVLILDGQSGTIRSSGSFCTYDTADQYVKDYPNGEPCTGEVEKQQAVALMDSLIGTAERGDYIFTRTRNLARRGDGGTLDNVRNLFKSLGSTAWDTLNYNDLWLMKARKGYPKETVDYAADDTNEITRTTSLTFSFPNGTTTSPLIGPATRWGRLAGRVTEGDNSDRIRVDVIAATSDTLLHNLVLSETHELSSIDPTQHRYLQLRATLTDSTERTAPPLESWHVTYDGVSDLAVDPSTLATSSDTLQKGEAMEIAVDVRNLSELASERAVVRFALTNQDNRTTLIHTDTLSALPADSARTVHHTFSTEDYVTKNERDNRLRVTVEQPGVPETVTHNNVLLHTFRVQDDTTPPQFTVTVDGEPSTNKSAPLNNLQDPEIPFVSARPTIRIEMGDDSDFLPITDADFIDIYLNCDPEEPSTSCETVSTSDTSFVPVTRDDSIATVTYRPDLSHSDTTHTLHVLARDASGNERQLRTYFRVQQDIEVENLYPYPNPMHSFTRFAFRLRGADVSSINDFRLRIFTVNGRLVRELDLKENGLHIGWNRIPWDTRDADGDLIANGVYLYKVYLRADGKSLPVNSSAVEKLVVLR